MIADLWHIRTLILLIVGGALTLLTLRSLRAQRLKERYVLLFLLTGMPFLVFAVWPDAIVLLSEKLEIEKPTLLILFVSIYFILTTFELLSLVSVQGRKIDTLGQMVGILMAQRDNQKSDDAPAATDADSASEQPAERDKPQA